MQWSAHRCFLLRMNLNHRNKITEPCLHRLASFHVTSDSPASCPSFYPALPSARKDPNIENIPCVTQCKTLIYLFIFFFSHVELTREGQVPSGMHPWLAPSSPCRCITPPSVCPLLSTWRGQGGTLNMCHHFLSFGSLQKCEAPSFQVRTPNYSS